MYRNLSSQGQTRRLQGLVTAWSLCCAGVALLASLSCSGAKRAAPETPTSASASTAAANERRYTVFLMERTVGEAVIRTTPEGKRIATYMYTDRGRGPNLRSEVTAAANGIPQQLLITGHDYWKSAVDERFTFSDGKAQWQNAVEADQVTGGERAFYVPLVSTPAEIELLTRALLAAPEHSLELFPAGEARIETLGTATATTQDQSMQVTLYGITGLGLMPAYVWCDQDTRLFAQTGSWQSLIRAGWEDAVPALRDQQQAAENKRLRRLAQLGSQRPQGEVVFANVRVFDARTAAVMPSMTVVIAGDRIERVGRTGTVPIPDHALVIDGTDHTLLPGLWDMHVHVGASEGMLHIAAGVTTARDLANDIEDVQKTKGLFDSGEVIGPRLILAGFMDGTSEYTGPTKIIVDTVEQAQSAIDRYADLGYEQIKVYSSIQPQLVPAIVKAAHSRGLRVSGHIPAFMTAEQAVQQGFDEIQHINFLILNFLFDKVQDTRTPARFTAVAEHAAELDMDSSQVNAFVGLLKDRNVVIDPTVAIFETLLVARKGETSPGYAAIASKLPVGLQRALRSDGLPVPEGRDSRYRASFAALLRLIAKLHQAGVRIVAGTDSLAGFTLHRELELYVEAGIPAPQVLRLATLGAAQIATRDAELGTIEAGKIADLVLVRGDPAAQISDIRRTALTVKGGVLHPAAPIYEHLGIQHDVPAPLPANQTASH